MQIVCFCQGCLFLQKLYSTHILHKRQKDLVKVNEAVGYRRNLPLHAV